MNELQTDARPDALLGKTIADRYQLLEIIGQGGLGVVYKARHIHMDRLVALKMLLSESLKDERNRQRFQTEAKTISSLNHPNIVSVFDFGFTADNYAFLVMDYLDGKDLDTLIQESGYLTPEEVVPVFTQICDALTQIHQAGIIHRDLKPGNIIIIKKDGSVTAKLVDFGMVKRFDSHSGRQAQSLTQPGEVFGSPYYMSPEQCRGLKLDPRTDIYSMGVLMYEAVTGRPPFLADNMVAMAQLHLYEPPEPIGPLIDDPKFPDWMQNLIFKALEKKVENRYQTAAELKEALLAFNKFWLEKGGPEKKPLSLRQTTTSRRAKEEVLAAVRAAEARKKEARESVQDTKDGAAPRAAEPESSRKALFLKPSVVLLGGVGLGVGLAVSLFFLLGGTKEHGTDSSRRWQSLDESGQQSLSAGNLSEAESDFHQALLVAENNGEKDNPALSKSMLGLATVYERQSKFEMAESVYKQLLARVEKSEGKSSALLAPVLVKLGSLYCSMNRLDEAEKMHRQAMNILEKSFGHDDEHMAACLKSYAETKRKKGQVAEAKEMQERADKLRERKNTDAGQKK